MDVAQRPIQKVKATTQIMITVKYDVRYWKHSELEKVL